MKDKNNQEKENIEKEERNKIIILHVSISMNVNERIQKHEIISYFMNSIECSFAHTRIRNTWLLKLTKSL